MLDISDLIKRRTDLVVGLVVEQVVMIEATRQFIVSSDFSIVSIVDADLTEL